MAGREQEGKDEKLFHSEIPGEGLKEAIILDIYSAEMSKCPNPGPFPGLKTVILK